MAGNYSLAIPILTNPCVVTQGQDPPLKKDEELPDWLWKLAEPEKTVNELRRMGQEELTPNLVRPRQLHSMLPYASIVRPAFVVWKCVFANLSFSNQLSSALPLCS
jgi:hypothetical protein